MSKFLILMLSFCLMVPVQAMDWDRVDVGAFESTDNETLVDFLKRVGQTMHEATKISGHEVCGAIAEKDGRFAVRLTTDGVPHGCVINASNIPLGFVFTGETIHSHPWHNVIKMDARAHTWSAKYAQRTSGATLRNDGRSGFSRADYQSGPGWLVAGGQLLHQNGSRNVTRHGEIER